MGGYELTPDNVLGECKAFVGEHNERKKQDRLCLRVARERMRTDRSVDDIHINRIGIEFTSTGPLCHPIMFT